MPRFEPAVNMDPFVAARLPAPEALPQFIFERPELQFPAKLNLVEELLDKAEGKGFAHRPLLRSPGITLTYAEVRERVDRIAQVLSEDLQLIPGQRVLLRGGNSIGMALAWLAVVKAGLIAVATMPLLRAKELADVIDKAQPDVALCDATLLDELQMAQSQFATQCASLKTVVPFNLKNEPGSLAMRSTYKMGGFVACKTAANDVALMAFTSGTTGKPKAALHTHRDVLAACECWPRHVLKPTPDDVVIGSPPLAFTFGLGGMLIFPMWAGASVYFHDAPYTPQVMVEVIHGVGATICFTAPTFYRQMAAPFKAIYSKQGDNLCKSALRVTVSAGEALPDATRQLWKAASGLDMVDGIGATEMFHIFISSAGSEIRAGAIGKVVPGYIAKVVDEAGQELPKGSVGQLAVIGPTGCKYLGDARQANYVKRGWNYPGDAFRQDEDGYFYHQSRTDDMIVTSGYNVGAPEVEDALMQHPSVSECAVVGKPDDERGMVIKAFVVLKPGQLPGHLQGESAEAAQRVVLQDHVKRVIAPYKYPREIEFVASLPRTETGKLQRFKLKQVKTTMKQLQPPGWAPAKGYTNGIAARGTQLFVGGQIGWNAQQQFESDDFIAQTAQALRNVVAVLNEAAAGPEHIVRMTWYIINRDEYLSRLKELGAVYREVMGRNFAAMSCVQVAALMEARAKVEIEVTAVLPD